MARAAMKLTPRHDGLSARCKCGAIMQIPSASAQKFGLIWCPCGSLQPIGKKMFNQMMVLCLKANMGQA